MAILFVFSTKCVWCIGLIKNFDLKTDVIDYLNKQKVMGIQVLTSHWS